MKLLKVKNMTNTNHGRVSAIKGNADLKFC
jgi:hypothetical protein